MTEDFDLMHPHFDLPYTVSGLGDVTTVDKQDQLRALFERACQHYQSLGVVHIDRVCTLAEIKDGNVLSGFYQTRLLTHDNQLARPPYAAMGEMIYDQGRWKIKRGNYAVEKGQAEEAVLVAAPPAGPFAVRSPV